MLLIGGLEWSLPQKVIFIFFAHTFYFLMQEQADEILLIYDWGEVAMLGVLPAVAAGFVVLAIFFRAISLPFERAGCCPKEPSSEGAAQGSNTAPQRPLPQVPPHTQGMTTYFFVS